jgi:hypothetical protein
MSFFGLKRRGLRLVVSRGEVVDNRVALTLECGHVVTRDHRESAAAKRAVCPPCAKVDGDATDEAKRRKFG